MSLRRGGFEPPTFGSVDRCQDSVTDATTTGYESADGALTDSLTDIFRKHTDLAAVVAAWAELPEAVRAGIVAMVKATGRVVESERPLGPSSVGSVDG